MLTINFSTFPTIEINRLLLRQITKDDVADLFIIRSNNEAMQFIDRPLATTENDALDLIELILNKYEKNEAITWAVCLKEDAKLIGTIGFWQIDKQNYRAEIGYILNPYFHRKGLMQEAIEAIINFGFNRINLHSIEANINPNNVASKNILTKNGFVQEAFFRENHYYNGKFLDSMIFSLLKDSRV